MPDWFVKLPLWVRIAIMGGGGLMSACSGVLPVDWQAAGFYLGGALALIGAIASALHLARRSTAIRRMGAAQMALVLGLVGAWLCGTVALGAVVWIAWTEQGIFANAAQTSDADEGPLKWFHNLTLEGGTNGRNVFSLRFKGVNVSQSEIELESANITSAVDGTRLTLEIIAVNGGGENEIVPIDQAQLVPPGARMELVAKFNLPDGQPPDEFLATWRQFFLNVKDDTRSYRLSFNEADLMVFFPGMVGPRVRKKDGGA